MKVGPGLSRIMLVTREEEKPITCNQCKEGFLLSDNTVTRDLGRHQNRSWFQAGIECPHCKTFFHSFYTHDKLEKRKTKLKKMTGHKLNIEKLRIKGYHSRVQQEAKELFN